MAKQTATHEERRKKEAKTDVVQLAQFDSRKKLSPKEILSYAIKTYNIRHIVGLFSGGKDSYLTCVITEEAIKELEQELGVKIQFEILHCYTGTGSHKTFEYVLKTADKHGWKLNVEFPDEEANYPQNEYIRILYEKGFLGRPWHSVWLKVQGMRRFYRKNKDIWYISGKSPTNSARRKKQVEKAIKAGHTLESLYAGRDDGLPSIKPMFYLTKKDTWKMIYKRGLETVESYQYVSHSLECLCPAFATLEELKNLEVWYPENATDIHILDDQYGGWHWVTDSRGRRYRKNFGKWGEPPTTKMLRENQEQLEALEDLACFDCSAVRLELEN